MTAYDSARESNEKKKKNQASIKQQTERCGESTKEKNNCSVNQAT